MKITMKRDKECKGSVRFATDDAKAAVSNVYVSREVPGINHAQAVIITVDVIGAAGEVVKEGGAA